MRAQAFGGPAHGLSRQVADFRPFLTPVGETDEEIAEHWSNLQDGQMPPPESIGMYVPWIAWYDRTIFAWAGTKAEPNRTGRRWFFFWKDNIPEQVHNDLLWMRLQKDVVWLRSFPTSL